MAALPAIQDLIPDNHCYGCGPDNESGMRIKSYWDGAESRCEYMPRPEQCAGPTQFVYGGTIASLVDCHSMCTAIAHRYETEGRRIGEGESIWFVTGRLTVNYLAPTPIDAPIKLIASIEEFTAKKTVLRCQVLSGDTVTAEGHVIGVRVSDSWRG